MIIRSEHSFGPGRANSTITAKWVASTYAKVTQGLVPGTPGVFTGDAVYCHEKDEKDDRSTAAKETNATSDDSWWAKWSKFVTI